MDTGGYQFDAEESHSGLKRFCFCLIEFLSAQATDPHLYFQNKLGGDVANAKTAADLWNLLEQLIAWIEASNPHPSAIETLGEKLEEKFLPSFALMAIPANRELGRILASGRIDGEHEYKMVKSRISQNAGLTHWDLGLSERLVHAYESAK